MTENTMRSIPVINAVDGFNPADFTRNLPNEDGTMSMYLDVKYRLLWFRLHRPEGKIDTEIIHVDDKSAVVSCKLYESKTDPADQYIARSCAQRFVTQEKFGDRYLEIAETAAIGRVLAAAGYGTQFCGSTDLMTGVVADSPIDISAQEDNEAEIHSNVVHQVNTSAPVTVPTVTLAASPATPKLTTLDDYLNSMTIDDAKNVIVDIGRYAGSKLGDIVMSNPRDLEWYVKFYAGKNLALKAGAILLMQAATAKAS